MPNKVGSENKGILHNSRAGGSLKKVIKKLTGGQKVPGLTQDSLKSLGETFSPTSELEDGVEAAAIGALLLGLLQAYGMEQESGKHDKKHGSEKTKKIGSAATPSPVGGSGGSAPSGPAPIASSSGAGTSASGPSAAAPVASSGNSSAAPTSSSGATASASGPVQEVGPKTGKIVDVPGGKVDSSIAGNVTKMMADAKKDGVDLKIESSFRSREEQEKLYAAYQNGTGNLAAKPGTSNHESGLAIDFQNTSGAFDWLKKNAGRYGLKNLPSEPWHYSTTGT